MSITPSTGTGEYDSVVAAFVLFGGYLEPDNIHLEVTGGANFGSQGVTTADTQHGSHNIAIAFDPNNTGNDKVYIVTATATGEAGEQLSTTFTYTHKAPAGASLSVSGTPVNVEFTGGTVTFSGDYSNVHENTIGMDGSSSVVPSYSNITATGGSLTFTADIPFNTGDTRNITVTISATTLTNTTITASTVVSQDAFPTASLSITPTNGSVASTATTATFNVSWTNLKPNSNITFSKSSTITGSTPDTGISITSANAGSGSQSVTIRFTQNSGNNDRNLILTGTAQNLNSSAITATGKYVQEPASTSYQNIKFNTSVAAGSVTSLSLAASETSSYHYAVEEKYINGTFSNYHNDTSSASYTLYSGTSANNCNTNVGSFTYSTAQMYSDAYLTISGNGIGTSAKINFVSNSSYTSARYYRLTATDDGDTAEMKITIAAYVPTYSPNIWWTKTNGGAESTAVSSVTDIPAYVSGTYDGRNVTYTIYINYNSDVNTVTMDTTSLTNGASATRNDKTVTITVPVNKNSSRSLGSITITGTASDGTTSDSETLSLTQVVGVSPEFTIAPASQSIAADGTSATATLTYNYVDPSSIATSATTGNITNVTIS